MSCTLELERRAAIKALASISTGAATWYAVSEMPGEDASRTAQVAQMIEEADCGMRAVKSDKRHIKFAQFTRLVNAVAAKA